MSSTSKFLISNGVVLRSSDAPPVATFLETHPGAYTTTRSDDGGSRLLFWERHLERLCDSVRILSASHPRLLFGQNSEAYDLSRSFWESELRTLVNESAGKILPIAEAERSSGEALSVTAIVTGNSERPSDVDCLDRDRVSDFLHVHVHVGIFKPLVFGVLGNGANLAVVGRRREAAEAKYTDWVRVRKRLENLRSPSTTELLLSDNGDQILEGTVSNFFVVRRKDKETFEGKESVNCFEVQTALIKDGVLPGIIRQLVIEICLAKGIPFREVAPSWSEHETWEEAFITNSLRLLQHSETISVPDSWDSLETKSWNEISWTTKQFEECPGIITRTIQKEVMRKADLEGWSFNNFV